MVLSLNVEKDQDRAERVWQSHLARAKWMTETGYRAPATWCAALGLVEAAAKIGHLPRESSPQLGLEPGCLSPPDRSGRRQRDRHDTGKRRCARIGQITTG